MVSEHGQTDKYIRSKSVETGSFKALMTPFT
jgi:hypothetical protein